MGASKKIVATEPMPPVPWLLPETAYHRAIRSFDAGQQVEMPCAFNHPEVGRVAGHIETIQRLGTDPATGLEEFTVTIRGRTGRTADAKLLEDNVRIYHTLKEADDDVSNYQTARGQS